jgi:hypothetical protein
MKSIAEHPPEPEPDEEVPDPDFAAWLEELL